MTKQYDFTEGVIWKKILLFFLPILAGSLFQQLYTTVDAVIIGQFAGKNALASIDAIYNLTKLPINFFVGLSTGATIIISQYFGAKDNKKLSTAVHTAAAFAFSGGLLLSIAGIAAAPACLDLLKIPEEIYPSTLSYVRIYFSGLAVSMTYNIGAGILRAVGQSKMPFYFLAASNTLNVFLDLLFVGLFRWDVQGAALATVLSQLLSAILVLTLLLKTNLPCRLRLKRIRFSKPVLHQIFLLGLPVGVQSSFFPVANMMIQSNINIYGVTSIAAWAVCGKLDFLIWLAVDSLGAALSTFSAQNFGAHLHSRIKKSVRVCAVISLCIVLPISAILYFACGFLSTLFIRDSEVIALCVHITRLLAPFYCCYIGGELLSGALRGTGETFIPMLLTLIGTCACRIAWVLFIVPLKPGLETVLWSYPVSWIATSLLFLFFYQRHKSRKLSKN